MIALIMFHNKRSIIMDFMFLEIDIQTILLSVVLGSVGPRKPETKQHYHSQSLSGSSESCTGLCPDLSWPGDDGCPASWQSSSALQLSRERAKASGSRQQARRVQWSQALPYCSFQGQVRTHESNKGWVHLSGGCLFNVLTEKINYEMKIHCSQVWGVDAVCALHLQLPRHPACGPRDMGGQSGWSQISLFLFYI